MINTSQTRFVKTSQRTFLNKYQLVYVILEQEHQRTHFLFTLKAIASVIIWFR